MILSKRQARAAKTAIEAIDNAGGIAKATFPTVENARIVVFEHSDKVDGMPTITVLRYDSRGEVADMENYADLLHFAKAYGVS